MGQHYGDLSAHNSCVVCGTDASKLHSVISMYQQVHWLCIVYARAFLANLVSFENVCDLVKPPALADLTAEIPKDVDGDVIQAFPFEEELPFHIQPVVCRACIRLATDIAAMGLDENRPHHGFTIIIGDSVRLENCGRAGFNPFHGQTLKVISENGVPDDEILDIMRRNAFHGDGAIVIDGTSGAVIASGWFVSDISLGGKAGGARSLSARAIAQQAGYCFVIKCSEDSRGVIDLHLGTSHSKFSGQLAAVKEVEQNEYEHDYFTLVTPEGFRQALVSTGTTPATPASSRSLPRLITVAEPKAEWVFGTEQQACI